MTEATITVWRKCPVTGNESVATFSVVSPRYLTRQDLHDLRDRALSRFHDAVCSGVPRLPQAGEHR